MADKTTEELLESHAATERVSIYCTPADREQWTTEAETGYSSRSEYLYELVQESRRYRAKGFLSRERKQTKIRQLQAEIERLKAELEDETGQESHLIQTLENPEMVKRGLANKYQSLQDITQKLLVHDSVTLDARGPVERALFELAQHGEATYQRGHGWRLAEDR